MDWTVWLSVLVVDSVVCGALGWYVAREKRRAPAEGLLLGALCGPLGVVAVGLLPNLERADELIDGDAPSRPRQVDPDDDQVDDAKAMEFLGAMERGKPRPPRVP